MVPCCDGLAGLCDGVGGQRASAGLRRQREAPGAGPGRGGRARLERGPRQTERSAGRRSEE
eukprot:14998045-Alexandrium_andersonii.AAC.1